MNIPRELFYLACALVVAIIVFIVARRNRHLVPSYSEDVDEGAYFGPAEMEAFVRENITDIADCEFPDNTGLTWKILGFTHREGMAYAEVEPSPGEVGYDRFKFVLGVSGGKPHVMATYCLEDNVYTLLCTSPKLKKKLPKELI
ncbi:MAG: hypothetical protein V3T30_05800 [Thermodesulfobacteriota bacterium]